MADTIKFTPNGGAEQTLFDLGVVLTHFLALEQGWGNPPDSPFVETIPDTYGDLDRNTTYKPRVYTITIDVFGSTHSDLRSKRRTWNGWHLQSLGVGVLKRVTSDALTRCLDCRPMKPQWEDVIESRLGVVQRVVQGYVAAQPFWRDLAESDVSGNFNGANAVNLSIANAGSIPCPVRFVIGGTSTIEDAKMTNDNGDIIEVEATTSHADDQIEINTDIDSVGIVYTPNGGAADPSWYGYRSDDTKMFYLPLGTKNVVLTCTAGTTDITSYWRNRYASL